MDTPALPTSDNRERPAGLIVAAPASGSGKTALTLALVRALSRSGQAVQPFKVGPDYIDPGYHTIAADGRQCINLDPWAMSEARIRSLARHAGPGELALVEGVMGLFDGAASGGGSTADLAAMTGWPVILVIDVRRQSQSVAALVHGFARYRPDVEIAGTVLNRIGSERHGAMIRDALAPLGIPVLGALPNDAVLDRPSRYLGLVQASEDGAAAAERFIDGAARLLTASLHMDTLRHLSRPLRPVTPGRSLDITPPVPPPGQRIALARDDAFAFSYPHVVDGWRAAGAEVLPFSPLADEAPAPGADSLVLPGGYPELHAARLAANQQFRDGVAGLWKRNVTIYGECGGYMVLGERLIDANGQAHPMLGLLPLITSIAQPQRSLGYRSVVPTPDAPHWLEPPLAYRAHEFHYARTVDSDTSCPPLWMAADAAAQPIGEAGLVVGRVSGSFIHLIDRAS